MSWIESRISPDGTFHLTEQNKPMYNQRFHWVLPFHEPGLAPVGDGSGSYHIRPDGSPAYHFRFSRTFGFYQGYATVTVDGRWFHIQADGNRSYEKDWAWCGNFQNNRCSVRDHNGDYYHINLDGSIVPNGPWTYAGDYREGAAVVRTLDGLCRHIDEEGCFIHEGAFFDLDVFHKGFARARDGNGWFHIDRKGEDVSGQRFLMLEPFYNGQALARKTDGSILVIDEKHDIMTHIQSSEREKIQWFHDIAIAYWVPFAVKLGLEAGLAGGTKNLTIDSRGKNALKRAWIEIGLLDERGGHLTKLGSVLKSGRVGKDLIDYWMGPQLIPWIKARNRLQGQNIPDFFKLISEDPGSISLVHRVLDHYAQSDWSGIAQAMNLNGCETVVDLAGGSGSLLNDILATTKVDKGILFERPEVVRLFKPNGKIELVAGDLFSDDLPTGDVYILSRVLHDWDDERAGSILKRIGRVAGPGSRLFVIDRVNDHCGFGLLDLNMYLTTGGTERTMEEWEILFKKTGWSINTITHHKGHHIFQLGRSE